MAEKTNSGMPETQIDPVAKATSRTAPPAAGDDTYLIGQQNSQPGLLPEDIPTTAERKADAKRAASRKNVTQSFWSLVRHQFKKNRVAHFALYVVYFLFAVAIFADILANDKPLFTNYKGEMYFPVFKQYAVDLGISRWPKDLVIADWRALDANGELSSTLWTPIKYSETNQDLTNVLQSPNGEHLLGTDGIGRDVLAGMIHGSRIALTIGFVSMFFALGIGILLGALAGFYGGWIDVALSRIMEVVITLPSFFLIITVVAMMQHGSIFLIMVLIGVTGWTGVARLTRGEFLRVRNMDFVSAATALGFKDRRIVFRHVLPNALAPVLVTAAFGIAGAILTESSLSFLGFGVPPTVVTWGSVLNDARNDIHAWWLAVFPGFAIFLAVVSYNLVGDGLRDALDPRLRD